MHYYRLIISYQGTHYYGWQDMGTCEDKPTLQVTIQKALNKICKYKSCTISTASRTDAGVHAQGQVVKITIPLLIESKKLLLGMNSLLPKDIRVLNCEPCTSKFNANTDSKSKEYHYYFCTDTVHNPVLNDTVAHIPHHSTLRTTESINIEGMQEACALFIGEHDFYSFAKRDSHIGSTFRTIISCEILPVHPSLFSSNVYCLKIIGTGFLRYMVRYIASALFALGKKQLSINDISEALAKHKEEKISPKAKSQGLHLIQICY